MSGEPLFSDPGTVEGIATSFTITLGQTPTEGNVLIAFITSERDATISTTPIASSNGYTQIYQHLPASGTSDILSAWYKVAGAGEDSTPTWTGPNRRWVGSVHEYDAAVVDVADLINIVGAVNTGWSATNAPKSLGVTTDANGCIILGAAMMQYDTDNLTVSSGLTGIADVSTSGIGSRGLQMVVGSLYQDTLGATGDYTHSIAGTTQGHLWIAQTVALNTVAAPPAVNNTVTISVANGNPLRLKDGTLVGTGTPLTGVSATLYLGQQVSPDAPAFTLTDQTVDGGEVTLEFGDQGLSSTNDVTIVLSTVAGYRSPPLFLTID